jgi:hypothetical protein
VVTVTLQSDRLDRVRGGKERNVTEIGLYQRLLVPVVQVKSTHSSISVHIFGSLLPAIRACIAVVTCNEQPSKFRG